MNEGALKKIKYQEQILGEMNLILRRQISDKRFQFVSFTKVELTPDYSQATVFWDTFDSSKKDEISEGLKKLTGKMKSELAQVLKVKQIPELIMKYDSQYESEKNITDILESESKEGRSF